MVFANWNIAESLIGCNILPKPEVQAEETQNDPKLYCSQIQGVRLKLKSPGGALTE